MPLIYRTLRRFHAPSTRKSAPEFTHNRLSPCNFVSCFYRDRVLRMHGMKALLFALIMPAATIGRLGETIEQCTARYGEPVKTQDGSTFYKKGEILISIHFRRDGKADALVFSKGEYGRLDIDEVNAIL